MISKFGIIDGFYAFSNNGFCQGEDFITIFFSRIEDSR